MGEKENDYVLRKAVGWLSDINGIFLTHSEYGPAESEIVKFFSLDALTEGSSNEDLCCISQIPGRTSTIKLQYFRGLELGISTLGSEC